VIEDSYSPWISPAVLEKKTTQLDFVLTLENLMPSLKKILIRYRELMIF